MSERQIVPALPGQPAGTQAINVDQNYTASVYDQALNVVAAGVLVTLPPNPTAGDTSLELLASAAFNLSGGANPLTPSDPMAVTQGSVIIASFSATGWILLQGGSGGSSSLKPLSRTWFVDAGSTAATPNGSIGAAFPNITAATTALGPSTSSTDAETAFTIFVCPGEYLENVTIPAGRTLILAGFTANDVPVGTGQTGVTIEDVTWANAPSAFATSTSLTLKDVFVGDVFITDSGGSSPPGVFYAISTAGPNESFVANELGGLVATGATNLVAIGLFNYVVGALNAPNTNALLLGSSVLNSAASENVSGENCFLEIAEWVTTGTQAWANTLFLAGYTAEGSTTTFEGCSFEESDNVFSATGVCTFTGCQIVGSAEFNAGVTLLQSTIVESTSSGSSPFVIAYGTAFQAACALTGTTEFIMDSVSAQTFQNSGGTWPGATPFFVEPGFLGAYVPVNAPITTSTTVLGGDGTVLYVGAAPESGPGDYLTGAISISFEEGSWEPYSTVLVTSQDTSGNVVTVGDNIHGPFAQFQATEGSPGGWVLVGIDKTGRAVLLEWGANAVPIS
jgi:hypothetical protein